MPKDQVAIWQRGDNWLVRFPHSHTVRIPTARPDLLERVLKGRYLASIRTHGLSAEAGLPGPTQAEVAGWLGVNVPKKLPTGDAIRHTLPAPKVPRIRLDHFIKAMIHDS